MRSFILNQQNCSVVLLLVCLFGTYLAACSFEYLIVFWRNKRRHTYVVYECMEFIVSTWP